MYDYDASFAQTQGDIDDEYSLLENYKINLLPKSPEWKVEHEFRWLVVGNENCKLLVSIENAIKAVCVSWDDFYETDPLKAKCEELKIQFVRLVWKDGKPKVLFPEDF
jgi:hypothetical protein